MVNANLSTETIAGVLHEHYGLTVKKAKFLPLGNDIDASVYRIVDEYDERYFLKLNQKNISEAGIEVEEAAYRNFMENYNVFGRPDNDI